MKRKLNKLLVGEDEYFLMTKQDADVDDSFKLTLCNGKQAWEGAVSDNDLHKQCKKLKMNYEEFLDETTKALTKENVGALTFIYDVKNTAAGLELSWKKHVTAEDIKFQLGSATLSKADDPAGVMRGVFDMALEGMSALSEQIVALETKNERLTAERATALKKLEKYVSAKEELEQDLYSKFAVILNGKKAKLRDLRINLEDAKSMKNETKESTDGSGDADASSGRNSKAKAASDDDDDLPIQTGQYDEDAETSEEERVSQAKQRKGKVSSSPADDQSDSLLLSGEETIHTAPTARRRRRPQTAKKTPSKPVLPKVSSGETPGPSRPKLRKSNSKVSSSSNISSDNLEDMIEDM